MWKSVQRYVADNTTLPNTITVGASWNWSDLNVQTFVSTFYTNLKICMPFLMAYRYQTQILDNIVNGNGFNVTDYDTKENSTRFAAIPVMKMSQIQDALGVVLGLANYDTSMSFSYANCIVDLNPINGDVGNTQFPMSFVGELNVNVDDTYKKDKLLLTKVKSISGKKSDTFELGSHSSDYNLITDMEARKYRDPESNPDGAIDDHIAVTLGNGGSYQKKRVDVEKNTNVKEDLFAVPMSTNWDGETTYNTGDCVRVYNGEVPEFYTSKRNENRGHAPASGGDDYWDPVDVSEGELEKLEKKYYRSKHFFIDPFELTIAQWCYVYGMHRNVDGTVPTKEVEIPDSEGRNPGDEGYVRTTKIVFDEDAMKDNARANFKKNRNKHNGSIGESKFNEMERSYWKYLSVWEKDEWAQLKEEYKNAPRGSE